MIIEVGEKIHVMMRRTFEGQVRRHFAGEVIVADRAIVKAKGYVFIYDETSADYVKKSGERTTILDLAESGYVVNMLPASVELDDLRYETMDQSYVALVDGKGYELDIHEFGVSR